MERSFSIGDLFREIGAVFAEHRGMVLGIFGAIVAAYTALDLVSEQINSISGVVVSVFVQYIFLEQVLPRNAENTGRRYGSLFGSGILSGLGIVIGLLFFILPGLFLSARWALTSAFVVAEQRRATDAISASWNATADCWQPLLVAYLIAAVPFLIMLGAAFFYAESLGVEGLGAVVLLLVINVLTVAFTLGAWLIAAAGYRLLAGRIDSIDDVFG